MSDRIYIDTNVWLDYCLSRGTLKPLDEYAKQLFDRSLQCEFVIVYSEITDFEIKKKADMTAMIGDLRKRKKLIEVSFTKKDIMQAEEINIHFPDNLHVHLARKYNCKYIITNDKEMVNVKTDLEIVNSEFFQFE